MTYWTPIWSFRTAKFNVLFSVAPEDIAYDGDDEDGSIQEAINSGELDWFVARVQVLHNGCELGVDYLGACAYRSSQEFVKIGDYFRDMVREAVSQARENAQTISADLAKVHA